MSSDLLFIASSLVSVAHFLILSKRMRKYSASQLRYPPWGHGRYSQKARVNMLILMHRNIASVLKGAIVKVKKIDHVGIAVKYKDSASRFLTDMLGARKILDDSWEYIGQQFNWAYFLVGELGMIELVSSADPDNFINKFIEKHGEGLHHVTIQVAGPSGRRAPGQGPDRPGSANRVCSRTSHGRPATWGLGDARARRRRRRAGAPGAGPPRRRPPRRAGSRSTAAGPAAQPPGRRRSRSGPGPPGCGSRLP